MPPNITGLLMSALQVNAVPTGPQQDVPQDLPFDLELGDEDVLAEVLPDTPSQDAAVDAVTENSPDFVQVVEKKPLVENPSKAGSYETPALGNPEVTVEKIEQVLAPAMVTPLILNAVEARVLPVVQGVEMAPLSEVGTVSPAKNDKAPRQSRTEITLNFDGNVPSGNLEKVEVSKPPPQHPFDRPVVKRTAAGEGRSVKANGVIAKAEGTTPKFSTSNPPVNQFVAVNATPLPAPVPLEETIVTLGISASHDALAVRTARTVEHSLQTAPRVALTPRAIASQISASVTSASSDTIELRLDPPELGKLIVSITQNESGVSTHIVAEKAEVAEFLRRHADLLSRELNKAGVEGSSLEFSHRQDKGNEGAWQDDSREAASGTVTLDSLVTAGVSAPYSVETGLDIRL